MRYLKCGEIYNMNDDCSYVFIISCYYDSCINYLYFYERLFYILLFV